MVDVEIDRQRKRETEPDKKANKWKDRRTDRLLIRDYQRNRQLYKKGRKNRKGGKEREREREREGKRERESGVPEGFG